MTKTLVVPLSAETDAEFKLMLGDLSQLPNGWAVADVGSDVESSGAKIGVITVKKESKTKLLVFPLSKKSGAEFDLFIEEWGTLKPRWRLIEAARALESGVPVAQFTIEKLEAETPAARNPSKTKRSAKKSVR